MYEEIAGLLKTLECTKKQYDVEKICDAFRYASALHEGQVRQSGDPYISHPIAVACILAELELDTDSICAALLHDTLEDCAAKTNYEEIRRRFNLTSLKFNTVETLVDAIGLPKCQLCTHCFDGSSHF